MAPSKIKSITFYFDPQSPFAYLGYAVLARYKQVWGFDKITMKPALLGAVIVGSGNHPPMTVPNKKKWITRDMQIHAEMCKMDFTLPDGFPNKTLNAVRFLRQLEDEKPELLETAAVAFWQANFGPTKYNVNDFQYFEKILNGVQISPKDIQRIIKECQSDDNKARVKTEAEKLVSDFNMFGMPWMIFETEDGRTETFWGSDRIEFIAHWLGQPYYGFNPDTRKSKL